MAAVPMKTSQNLVLLGEFLFLMRTSGGISVPMKAAGSHVLPFAVDFVRAGGALDARHVTYKGVRLPTALDYRCLEFLRSLIDHGLSVTVEQDELVVGVDAGLQIRIPIELAYAGLGMVEERFVRREFAAWDVRDAVVVDIGANVGDSLVYFMAHGAHRVLAYEPFPAAADVAARNIACNGLEHQVEFNRIGVAGSAEVRHASYDPLQPHLASSCQPAEGGTATVDIRLTSLATVLARARELARGLRPIGLKVDCEGCEGEIFEGETDLRDIDSALVETHSDRLQHQVVESLKAAGLASQVISEDRALSTALLLARRRR